VAAAKPHAHRWSDVASYQPGRLPESSRPVEKPGYPAGPDGRTPNSNTTQGVVAGLLPFGYAMGQWKDVGKPNRLKIGQRENRTSNDHSPEPALMKTS
jgi:hypothetical protein